MGKGDRRTKRGKRWRHSFGKARRQKIETAFKPEAAKTEKKK
jgi:ribosomal small subunit protein bTHX